MKKAFTTNSATIRLASELNIFEQRCKKAQKMMVGKGLDYLFVGPGADMEYLCNYEVSPDERLRLFILPSSGKPCFVTPAFEVPRFRVGDVEVFFDMLPWEETDDPMDSVIDLVGSAKKATIAVGDRHWGMFITGYLKRLPRAKLVSAETVLGEMRMHKDPTELGYLKQLGEALDRVWEMALELKYSGRNESDLAADLYEIKKTIFRPPIRLSPLGEHKPESGINSSSGQGGGLNRMIQSGDGIYWEVGRGTCNGYSGDKTRSVQVAPATEEFKKVHAIVLKAHKEAFNAIRPGVTCESIDQAGRQVIAQAGYGEYFTHRIGHGLGRDTHEPPYLVNGNKRRLEQGMVFTVEPGIYLPGKWGVRIEDTVRVTKDGAESFFKSTKEFHEVR